MLHIYIHIYIYIYDISSLRVNDLTLILLTWRKWTPNNASKWQMGFNSAFKGLSVVTLWECYFIDVYGTDVTMVYDRFNSYCNFLYEYVKMGEALQFLSFILSCWWYVTLEVSSFWTWPLFGVQNITYSFRNWPFSILCEMILVQRFGAAVPIRHSWVFPHPFCWG